MEPNIISAEDVQTRLAPLTMKQLDRLAELSGVPQPTIYKIKLGVTANPGVETIGKFWPYVDQAVLEA